MHRGLDLVTSVTAAQQVLEGQLTYGADKAVEDEGVELYACVADSWRMVGQAKTDEDGRFVLLLEGDRRLPSGLHALFASSVGDRSGMGFLAYVASSDARVAVADVDGTLTTSENGIIRSSLLGSRLAAQPGAADTFQKLASEGFQLVYLTARPRGTTEMTRAWLADGGFPAGPVVTAPGLTLPGRAALAHKVRLLDAFRHNGVPLTIGIGNRATDVTAYTRAGLPGARIFIKQPGYAAELRPLFERHQATSLESYPDLVGLVNLVR